MFDLPTYSSVDMREYRRFRQFLIKGGFIMMQESIYCKFLLNTPSVDLVKKQVRNNLPKDGLIQMLTVTERQFQNMELLSGELQSVYLDDNRRIVEL